jgi:hypothetical protein
MLSSAFRKFSLNSKTFVLYQSRCNIPKRTFVHSAETMDGLITKVLSDPDVLVGITKAYVIILNILLDICVYMYVWVYAYVNE